MRGPAARLWAERFGDRPTEPSVEAALKGAAALLSGTGWASDLEHEARRRARALGIASAAVLDHWVHYPERFRRSGEEVWPDEFWVTDEWAAAEAARCFPGQKVRVLPNLYLDELVRRIPPVPERSGPARVLYALEPARSDWGRGTPGEFQALDYFLEHRQALGLERDSVLRLRPHPSDPPGKYDGWLDAHAGAAALDEHGDLAQAIGACEWVAGAESFALVVGLAARRKVVCTLPPWAPPCRLPHPGLIHLKERGAR